MPIRLMLGTLAPKQNTLRIHECYVSAVVYHERVLLLQNESSGDGGNRIPVQKVIARKSTYIARFLV